MNMAETFLMVSIGLGAYIGLSHLIFSYAIYHYYFKERRNEKNKDVTSLVENSSLLVEAEEEVERRKVQRSKSAPFELARAKKVISEYDSFTGCSVPRQDLPLPKPPDEGPHLNSYDELDSAKELPKDDPRHYDTIVEQVATTLSEVYCKPNENQKDIYETFLSKLIKRIRMKSPELYNSIQNYTTMEKSHYTEILEDSGQRDSDEESTYATYIPSKNDLVKSKSMILNRKKKVAKGSTFGSIDHMKFLVESTKPDQKDKDTLYLKPNRYSAASNCPEALRILCEHQSAEHLEYTSEKDRITDSTTSSPRKERSRSVYSPTPPPKPLSEKEKLQIEECLKHPKVPPPLPQKLRLISTSSSGSEDIL